MATDWQCLLKKGEEEEKKGWGDAQEGGKVTSVKVGQFFSPLSSTNPFKYPFINVQCT